MGLWASVESQAHPAVSSHGDGDFINHPISTTQDVAAQQNPSSLSTDGATLSECEHLHEGCRPHLYP
jgi:hypothetical protein